MDATDLVIKADRLESVAAELRQVADDYSDNDLHGIADVIDARANHARKSVERTMHRSYRLGHGTQNMLEPT